MECSWLIHIPFRSSILLKQHKIQLFVSFLWRYRRHDIMASHVTVKPESTAERFWGFLANIRMSAAVLPIGENFKLSPQGKDLLDTLHRVPHLLPLLCVDGQKILQLHAQTLKLGHKNAESAEIFTATVRLGDTLRASLSLDGEITASQWQFVQFLRRGKVFFYKGESSNTSSMLHLFVRASFLKPLQLSPAALQNLSDCSRSHLTPFYIFLQEKVILLWKSA